MASESLLADALAFLDEVLQQPGDIAESLSLLGSDEWDPNSLFGDSPTETPTEPSPDQALTRGHQKQKEHGEANKRKKKPNKNKARDERRFVLIQLRDEVEKLEFTLKQLRTMRRKSIDHSCHASNVDSGVPPVWQEICARQLHRRLKAELENIRLKQELEREKQLVKNIEKLLYKRRAPKQTGPEAGKHTRRTDIPAGYIDRMAAYIFDELAADVELMYHEVEGVLDASSSFTTAQRPLLRGGVKGNEEKFVDRKVLSFSIHASGWAWWRNWHSHRGRSVQKTAGDTVVETFGVEMSDFNVNICVSSFGQQILRRSIEDHRVMFVWNAYMEPFVFENKRVSGIYFLEQCHVLIKREERDSAMDDGEFSTNMSTCCVITPYFLDPELQSDPKASALIDFFVCSMFSTMKVRSEMVENLLLDQALEEYNVG